MKNDKDYSVLTGDLSINFRELNETLISHITKESADKDFKELASLIYDFRDNKENTSIMSSRIYDKSNSILSNPEIWNECKSPDDSKQFIKNFNSINNKKKISNSKNDNKSNSKDFLTINTNLTPNFTKKGEDYGDDVDEKIDLDKKEINKNIFETNNNNLNEIYVKNSQPFKFYTSPDDVIAYRTEYNNFSFTPNYINDLISPKNKQGTLFPGIPENIDIDKLKDSNVLKNISTRNSTESNESTVDINNIKYFTPTHQNINKNYIIPHVQPNTLNYGNHYLSPNNINLIMSNTQNLKAFSFCANNTKSPLIRYVDNKKQAFTIDNKSNIDKEIVDHKINLENIIISKDKRTTLMLRNIPNKYTLNNLVDEIVNNNPSFAGKFDYINLPIDYERKLNLGYAFINFYDALHIVYFYECFYGKKWQKYKSDKKIELNYAEKQGKKDINNKDENTFFATEDKKIIQKKLNSRIEIPIKYFEMFKKINPTSVCVQSENIFFVKNMGKRLI